MIDDKIHSSEYLVELLEKERKKNNVIGFTNGCFDILHVGHVQYLEQARSFCDLLVVGVNSDFSVKRLKGDTRPVNSEDARMKVLAALESVAYVTLFEEDTPLDLIKKLSPSIIFKGGDWNEGDVVGGDFVRSIGGSVKIISYVDGFSTTNIIKKIER